MVIAVGINHYSTGREYEVLGLYFYAWGYKEDPRLHRTPTDLRKEFMIDDRARRRYYASRFSLFVSYGVNSTATTPGPACVRSLARKRGPVYESTKQRQASSKASSVRPV